MSKKIVINHCYECPNYILISCELMWCKDCHKYFSMEDIEKKIPDSCRLENNNENKS